MTDTLVISPPAPINTTLVVGQGPSGPPGVAGADGPQGPTGPQGPSGAGGDKFETWNQASAAATWNITHSLGKFPSVTVVDSAGSEIEGDVTYVDTSHITIEFSAGFAGVAYLN